MLAIAYAEESEAGVGRPEMMDQGRVGSQVTLTALQGSGHELSAAVNRRGVSRASHRAG